jgi:hypothetical protein
MIVVRNSIRKVARLAFVGVMRLFQLAPASGAHQLLMAAFAPHPELQGLRFFINFVPVDR